MKIAISASGATLNDELNPRLGRCEYFVIVDSMTKETQVISNTGRNSTGSAGIATAVLLSDQQVDVVITGNVGPNAYTTLEAAGIKVYTGASGKLKDVFQDYKEGKLDEAKAPTVNPQGR